MTRRKVRVSDHALIRYLERAGGFEIEKLRREIQNKVYRAAPEGVSGVRIDGVNFVIRSNGTERVVTTVLDAEWANNGAKGQQ